MEMDSRWFNRVRHEFAGYVAHRTGIRTDYLEIGTWEGASMSWMLDNVLTAPGCLAMTVDPYRQDGRHSNDEQEERYKEVVERLGRHSAWRHLRMPSDLGLRYLFDNSYSFDVVYIDGRHNAAGALEDFVLAFPMVRPGGIMIFDDYGIGQRKGFPHVPEAVQAVEIAYAGMVERIGVVGKNMQAAFRVTGKEQHP